MDRQPTMLLLGFCAVISLVASADSRERCLAKCSSNQVLDASSCTCRPLTSNPICPLVKCVTGPFPCRRYKKDARGCQTCQCQDRCSRYRCPRTCRAGTELYQDETNCTACRCKSQQVCTRQVLCRMFCPWGYQKDDQGCDMCFCLPGKSQPELL